jgi:hypothetical protein
MIVILYGSLGTCSRHCKTRAFSMPGQETCSSDTSRKPFQPAWGLTYRRARNRTLHKILWGLPFRRRLAARKLSQPILAAVTRKLIHVAFSTFEPG